MFVQLAGSAGSVTKGSVQSFRAMAMAMMMMLEIHPKESGPRPGNRIFMRTIVNAESRGKKSPRATRLESKFFRSRVSGLEERVSPETARSRSRSIFKGLGKAKEQEEVIRARHCYPTLGTLDRNRTWKPTTRPLRPRPPPPPFARALLSPPCGLRD